MPGRGVLDTSYPFPCAPSGVHSEDGGLGGEVVGWWGGGVVGWWGDGVALKSFHQYGQLIHILEFAVVELTLYSNNHVEEYSIIRVHLII